MVRSYTNKLADEAGSSLVEVLVAMTVLAIVIVPMVGMFEAGLRAATTSGDHDTARTLANEKLEEIRALPYSEPGGVSDSAVERYAPPGPPDGEEGDFAYAIRTTFVDGELLGPAGSPTGQMRVDVTVEWKEGSYSTAGVVSGEPP